jgi:uncharacterized protein with FMN-binding domain
VSHGLVALGSAAVLTVYTAGYAKTRSAAEQLSAAERPRPVAPAPRLESAPSIAPAPPIATPIAASPAPAASTPTPAQRENERAPRTSPAKRSTPTKTPAPAATPAIVEATPAPTPTPTPAPPPAPKWNDGSYSGWGRSRHGDIQATVAIENGKIVYVAISICDTRYPCDVIAKLPGQVLERQSPEVDFVAGATESTNAFYYAVVEALKKAK